MKIAAYSNINFLTYRVIGLFAEGRPRKFFLPEEKNPGNKSKVLKGGNEQEKLNSAVSGLEAGYRAQLTSKNSKEADLMNQSDKEDRDD